MDHILAYKPFLNFNSPPVFILSDSFFLFYFLNIFLALQWMQFFKIMSSLTMQMEKVFPLRGKMFIGPNKLQNLQDMSLQKKLVKVFIGLPFA